MVTRKWGCWGNVEMRKCDGVPISHFRIFAWTLPAGKKANFLRVRLSE